MKLKVTKIGEKFRVHPEDDEEKVLFEGGTAEEAEEYCRKNKKDEAVYSYMIRKRGDKWVVLTEDGSKILGTHDTEESAKKQLQAIEISKAKAAGKFEMEGVQLDFQSDLQTIRNVDIFASGTWRGSQSPEDGDVYSDADLQEMVSAYKAGILTPKIKITHGDDLQQVDVGQVRNLRVEGGKLFGDFVNVPRGLYELLKKGLFRSRSAEILWNVRDHAGKLWRRVVKAVALLAPGQKPAVSAISEGYQFEKAYCYTKDVEDGWVRSLAITRQFNIEPIIKAWPKWAGEGPGNFTRCVEVLKGKEGIDNPERLCAWLHKQATGTTPTQSKEHEGYQPSDAELSTLTIAVGAVLSYLTHEKAAGHQTKDDDNAEISEKEEHSMGIEGLLKKYGVKTEAELEERLKAEEAERISAKEKVELFEKEKREQRVEAIRSYVDGIVKQGRLYPKMRSEVLELLLSLDSKGMDKEIKQFQSVLNIMPNLIDLSERARAGDGTYRDDDGEIRNPALEVDTKAKAYIHSGRAKDYKAAIDLVRKDHPRLWKAYTGGKFSGR